MKYFSVAVLVVALCFGISSAFPSLGDLAYEFASTVRVIEYICLSGRYSMNDQLAQDFFNCYDAAPPGGRQIYTDCQIKTNGVAGVMNTTTGIKKACSALYTLPKYLKCLSDNFKAASIDLHEAVTSVNECEEKVLKIGSYAQ